MPRRRVAANDDAYLSKVAELKQRRDTAAECVPSATIHARDPRLDTSRKSMHLSQSDKRTPDSGDQWSLRQAMKAYQAGDRNSSRKLQNTAAAAAAEEEDSVSSSSSELSGKSSVSGSSSTSSEIPTTKQGRQMQHHVTYDAQPTQRASVRSQAEHLNSPRPAPAAALESNTAADIEEQSASPESSHRTISSSEESQTEAPSATARATKRPGPNSTEFHSTAKNSESAVVNDPLLKSSSTSHRSRSAAKLDKTTGGVERQQKVATTNDKDLLTSTMPMDRYERVERYLERSNMLPLPPANVDGKTQQTRHHRRHKHSAQLSLDEPARKTVVAAVRAAMPAKLLRDAVEQSNSENESDNNQNDIKQETGKKRHKRSDGGRSAKKHRRHRKSVEHVKYSFPPFDEPITKPKKRKRRGRPRYESPSSPSSSSAKDSASVESTPPPPPPPPQQRAHRKRAEVVEQRGHRRRQQTASESSSDAGSSRSGQSADNRRQRSAVPVARGGSVDSIMPVTKNHKLPKSIEHNSFAVPKRPPDDVHGRRSRNQVQAAAVTKATEMRHVDENENVINDADKDQWRKYFADLYTFNMLQKMKSTKKHKSKRRRANEDVDNDDVDGVERQNSFHPGPPDANATGFGSAESHPATNYNASQHVPFGNGSSTMLPPPPPPGTWPGQAAVDASGRPTLLPGPNEPIPLFALNLSACMPSVSYLQLLFIHSCGGLAQLVTSLVASTKLINAGPGLYLDG